MIGCRILVIGRVWDVVDVLVGIVFRQEIVSYRKRIIIVSQNCIGIGQVIKGDAVLVLVTCRQCGIGDDDGLVIFNHHFTIGNAATVQGDFHIVSAFIGNSQSGTGFGGQFHTILKPFKALCIGLRGIELQGVTITQGIVGGTQAVRTQIGRQLKTARFQKHGGIVAIVLLISNDEFHMVGFIGNDVRSRRQYFSLPIEIDRCCWTIPTFEIKLVDRRAATWNAGMYRGHLHRCLGVRHQSDVGVLCFRNWSNQKPKQIRILTGIAVVFLIFF